MSNYVNLLDIVYPVGSIYITTSSVSPATSIGGTWAALDEATYLSSAGSSETVTSTHGENSHVLTKNELPSHEHVKGFSRMIGTWVYYHAKGNGSDVCIPQQASATYGAIANNSHYITNECGNNAHNNRPKSYSVWMYRRTA